MPGGYDSELLSALYRAIPREDLVVLNRGDKMINGGFNYISRYFWNDPHIEVSAVASYNNTRKDEQEIIDWFERAKLLA